MDLRGIILVFLICSLCLSPGIRAQDLAFSQSYAAPLMINPALTGAIDGSYRVSAIYRDQWQSALPNGGYASFTASGDVRFTLENRRTAKDAFGVGLYFTSDKANPFAFNTKEMMVNLSYHKTLDKLEQHVLSVGFAGGVSQKSVTYDDAVFDDQFDGINQYNLPTAEELPANNYGYGDFQLGLRYGFSPSRDFSINAGFSLFHIFEPEQSFYREVDPGDIPLVTSNALHRRITGTLNSRITLNEYSDLTPRLIYSRQGPHQSLQLGTGWAFSPHDWPDKALHFGLWGTAVKEVEEYDFESTTLFAGFSYTNLLFGLSYDIFPDDLATYHRGMGVIEFSVRYIGNYENEWFFCPTF